MSKTNILTKELNGFSLFDKISPDVMKKTAFVLVIIFILNPALRLLLEPTLGIPVSIVMHFHNMFVLVFGICYITFRLRNLIVKKEHIKIKEFFDSNRAVSLLLVFAILMTATTAVNGFSRITLFGSGYRLEGLFGFLSYLIYFIIAAFVFDEKLKTLCLKIFAISSTLVCAVVFTDYIILDNAFDLAMGRVIFDQYNHLGYYLLMSIMTCGMFFLNSSKPLGKILGLIGFMFNTSVLIMNDTWGCQMALLVGIVFTVIVYSIAKGRFSLISTVLIAALFLTYSAAFFSNEKLRYNITKNIEQQFYDTGALLDTDKIDHNTTGVARIRLWQRAAAYMAERPFVGYGADVTGERLKAETHDNDRCHMEFLNYAVSFGIPATVFYIAGVFAVFLHGLLNKKRLTPTMLGGLCIAFAYLASSVVGNSMYYTAPLLFITLGIGYVYPTKKQTDNSETSAI